MKIRKLVWTVLKFLGCVLLLWFCIVGMFMTAVFTYEICLNNKEKCTNVSINGTINKDVKISNDIVTDGEVNFKEPNTNSDIVIEGEINIKENPNENKGFDFKSGSTDIFIVGSDGMIVKIP